MIVNIQNATAEVRSTETKLYGCQNKKERNRKTGNLPRLTCAEIGSNCMERRTKMIKKNKSKERRNIQENAGLSDARSGIEHKKGTALQSKK